jgi:ATP-dependent Clp protease ATP-binding subunit ClpC
MFERFTDRARRVVVLAQEEARMLNHKYIGTEHILLGLIQEGEGVAAKALESLGISLDAVRQQVEEIIGQGEQAPTGHIPFTPRAKKVLELSLREALQLGHNYIGTEHILLGLIREGDGVAAQVLVKLGADLTRTRKRVIQWLYIYHGNLTNRAGELDPVIGREKEIERVMQVLSRRTVSNPVLVGEPGTGKTAVVHGIAQRMAGGEVPGMFASKQILALDLAGMADASASQDEFDRWLTQVMATMRTRGDIILFIDGLHTFVGTGMMEPIDTGSMLKPMLARGELQMIGAATPTEYHKIVRRDHTLERTLVPIQVAESTIPHTIEILKGLRAGYESYHHVRIADSALVAAAQLAGQRPTDRRLPGKAIDLIDEAASLCCLRCPPAPSPDLHECDEEIAQIRKDMESAIDSQDLEKAAGLEEAERKLLSDRSALKEAWKAGFPEVDETLIGEALALVLGLPSEAEPGGQASVAQAPRFAPGGTTDDDREIWAIA